MEKNKNSAPGQLNEGIGGLQSSMANTTQNHFELEPLTIIEVFFNRKWFIGVCVALGFAISMIMAISSPKIYQARASFFALEGSRWSRNSGPFPTANGMGSFIQDTTSAKKDIARQLLLIIYSRSLAKKVIEQMPELAEHFMPGVDKNSYLYKDRLAQRVRKTVFVDLTNHTKPPILVVNMTDPKLAVKTANKYLEVLKAYIQENSLNQETKNRVYLEKQAVNYEKELKEAEEDLRQFEKENKLVSLDSQAETALGIMQGLKSKMIAKQREFEILAKSPTAPKSELRTLKEEISSLEKQIDYQEKGKYDNAEFAAGKDYTQIIAGGISAIPDLAVKHKRLKRNRDNFEKVHSMLIEKLELAKLKEQMKPTSFYILDPAVTASKIAPRVKLQSIYGAILGLFLACGYLIVITLLGPVTNKS
jgi:uncharacterized protein involved in exopolysaccharide biosynthesis